MRNLEEIFERLILEDKYTTEEIEDYFLALKEIKGFTVGVKTGYSSKTAQGLYTSMSATKNVKTHQVNITKTVARSGKSVDAITKFAETLESAANEIKKVVKLITLSHRIWYKVSSTYIVVRINFYEDQDEIAKVVKYINSKIATINKNLKKADNTNVKIATTFNTLDNTIRVYPDTYEFRNVKIFNHENIKELIENFIDSSRKLNNVYIDVSLGAAETINWQGYQNGGYVQKQATFTPILLTIEIEDVKEDDDEEADIELPESTDNDVE